MSKKVNTGVYLDEELLRAFDSLAAAKFQSRNKRLAMLMERDVASHGARETETERQPEPAA